MFCRPSVFWILLAVDTSSGFNLPTQFFPSSKSPVSPFSNDDSSLFLTPALGVKSVCGIGNLPSTYALLILSTARSLAFLMAPVTLPEIPPCKAPEPAVDIALPITSPRLPPSRAVAMPPPTAPPVAPEIAPRTKLLLPAFRTF